MTDVVPACPSGSWGTCPNAFRCHNDLGYPVMKCSVSGQHPDDCYNYSKPNNVKTQPKAPKREKV